jgi:hypothetical protein
MKIRVVLMGVALGGFCPGAAMIAVAQAAPVAGPAAASQATSAANGAATATAIASVPVTAHPKGHYAALDALPDWGGVWVLNRPAGVPAAPGKPAGEKPALKGKYLEDYQAWQHAVETKGGQVPHEGSYCTPPGMPGIMGVGQYPIEFLFTPGRVTTHHEAWMQWRNIYTDGRGHPDDLDATFEGDSIGHWEGTTLVVDTIGIKESVALGMGMKHSDKLHITERIHLAKGDPDTLVVEMMAEDPMALAKPWLHTYTYERSREWTLLEFICAENDRNPVDANGNTEFKKE